MGAVTYLQVGFSYCHGDPTGDGNSCGGWNDTRAANAEFASLRGWFDDKFPEYKTNDLYLIGESYAGVYIPKLAQEVIADNAGAHTSDPLNMKGFAVGDACTGSDVLCGDNAAGNYPWWTVMFFYGHGQFSTKLFNAIVDECTVAALQSNQALSPDCQSLLAQMNEEIGGYYAYNLCVSITMSITFLQMYFMGSCCRIVNFL